MVQWFADNFGVVFLWERKRGLNQAVAQATHWCIQKGAESVLVLPADIPLITSEDVNQIIKMSSEKISIVISTSQNGGTNALMRRPPDIILPHFGRNSFRKHPTEASAKGILSIVYSSQRVSLGIDAVLDLEKFLKVDEQTEPLNALTRSLTEYFSRIISAWETIQGLLAGLVAIATIFL